MGPGAPGSKLHSLRQNASNLQQPGSKQQLVAQRQQPAPKQQPAQRLQPAVNQQPAQAVTVQHQTATVQQAEVPAKPPKQPVLHSVSGLPLFVRMHANPFTQELTVREEQMLDSQGSINDEIVNFWLGLIALEAAHSSSDAEPSVLFVCPSSTQGWLSKIAVPYLTT